MTVGRVARGTNPCQLKGGAEPEGEGGTDEAIATVRNVSHPAEGAVDARLADRDPASEI